jgi:hypothetical protein
VGQVGRAALGRLEQLVGPLGHARRP